MNKAIKTQTTSQRYTNVRLKPITLKRISKNEKR